METLDKTESFQSEGFPAPYHKAQKLMPDKNEFSFPEQEFLWLPEDELCLEHLHQPHIQESQRIRQHDSKRLSYRFHLAELPG